MSPLASDRNNSQPAGDGQPRHDHRDKGVAEDVSYGESRDCKERNRPERLHHTPFALRAWKREIAPYLGVRYRVLVGETVDQARMGERDADDLLFVAGLRLAY